MIFTRLLKTSFSLALFTCSFTCIITNKRTLCFNIKKLSFSQLRPFSTNPSPQPWLEMYKIQAEGRQEVVNLTAQNCTNLTFFDLNLSFNATGTGIVNQDELLVLVITITTAVVLGLIILATIIGQLLLTLSSPCDAKCPGIVNFGKVLKTHKFLGIFS